MLCTFGCIFSGLLLKEIIFFEKLEIKTSSIHLMYIYIYRFQQFGQNKQTSPNNMKSFNSNLNVNHFKRLQVWRNAMYLCSKAKNLCSCSISILGIIQMNLFCLPLMRICLIYFNLFLHFHILGNYKF